jgi:predicted Zn-dependent peptidase
MSEVQFFRSHLGNRSLAAGPVLVGERHPGAQGCSMGILIPYGSRDEFHYEMGMFHLLEHLVFKRTKKRTAFQISSYLEKWGGELNAMTSKEWIMFYAYVLKSQWKKAVEILIDIAFNMDLKEADLILEKQVIAQEIAMGEDDPEEKSLELFLEEIYSGNSLSHSIAGNLKSLEKLNRTHLVNKYRQFCSPQNAIISVCGDLCLETVSREIQSKLKLKPNVKKAKPKNGIQGLKLHTPRKKPTYLAKKWWVEKDSEQVHLIMGVEGPSFKSKDKFCALLYNNLLAGGVTSNLYQAVREKKGLVYSIQSQLQTFTDCGLILLTASCRPEHMREVIGLVRTELHRPLKLTDRKLRLYKNQIKGSILLGSDDLESRMNSLALNEMVFKKYRSVNEVIREIESISLSDFNLFYRRWIKGAHWSALVYGQSAHEFFKPLQKI